MRIFQKKYTHFLTSIFVVSLGGLSTLAFAPYYHYLVIILSVAALFVINKKQSFKNILLFGFGFFFFGIHWITIALNTYGHMPYVGAIISTTILCIFLCLFFYPLKFFQQNFSSAIFVASSFTLLEWLRSFIFTGFPWLSLGYSQVPNSPLSGFLPIIGIHGISFLVILTVTLLLLYKKKDFKGNIIIFSMIAIIWGGGFILKKIDWTQPIDKPIKVSLIQGNIDQLIKWNNDSIQLSLKKYKDLIFQAQGELIILPETSIPLIYQKIPISFMQSLQEKMNATKSKIILGAIYKENSQYFNSAVYLHDNSINLYHKYHLVPFGEYIPLRPLLKFVYENWLQIPFNDLSRGTKKQALFKFNNNQIAANICYEDVFGNEIIRPFPNATMLVNLSNDAWYGQSNAAFQHLQISQARAIETGRMMLRATNTGATAIINEKGEIISHLPHFDVGILEGYAQGYEGETPYSKYGNYLIVLLSIMGVILSLKRKT